MSEKPQLTARALALGVSLGLAWTSASRPALGAAGAEQPVLVASESEALAAARELIEIGSYRQAAASLAARGDDLSPAGLALLGRALALDRRYLAAEAPLRRAVDAGWRDLPTLFYLGSTLWENGKPAAAETILSSALELSGGHPAILQQLGRLALWRGDWEAAVGHLDRALAAAPGDLDSILERARALEGAGRVGEALAGYRTVAARAPEHAGARYGLGRLLIASGAEVEGRAELETYRRLQQRDQEATRVSGRQQAELDRGLALLHAGDYPAAVAHLRALAPTPDVLDALARALAAAGEHEESLRALERAVALAPGRRDLRDRLTESRLAAPRSDGGR